MVIKFKKFIVIAGFLLLVFGLSSTHKQTWAADPAITIPAPGITLSRTTVTFEWMAGTQEDLYRLHLGTTGPGSKDILKANVLTTTLHTVTGIPLTGQTVYVRLWWRI
jgi:hypothetical protein